MASKASNLNGEEKKKKASYTLKLSSEQMDKLGHALKSRGWGTRTVQYARYAFDGELVKVVVYESGKLVHRAAPPFVMCLSGGRPSS